MLVPASRRWCATHSLTHTHYRRRLYMREYGRVITVARNMHFVKR